MVAVYSFKSERRIISKVNTNVEVGQVGQVSKVSHAVLGEGRGGLQSCTYMHQTGVADAFCQ